MQKLRDKNHTVGLYGPEIAEAIFKVREYTVQSINATAKTEDREVIVSTLLLAFNAKGYYADITLTYLKDKVRLAKLPYKKPGKVAISWLDLNIIV